jgi:hypothetical protein
MMFMSVYIMICQLDIVLHWPIAPVVGADGVVPGILQPMKWVLALNSIEPP